MSKIKIYLGPTPFTTAASENPAGTDPIDGGVIIVPASGYEQGDWIPCAVRCDSGFKTIEHLTRHARLSVEQVGGTGTDVNRWRIAPDDGQGDADEGNASTWGDHLDFNSEIDDSNTLFHVQAQVHEDEDPANDIDIGIKIEARIGAA